MYCMYNCLYKALKGDVIENSFSESFEKITRNKSALKSF